MNSTTRRLRQAPQPSAISGRAIRSNQRKTLRTEQPVPPWKVSPRPGAKKYKMQKGGPECTREYSVHRPSLPSWGFHPRTRQSSEVSNILEQRKRERCWLAPEKHVCSRD